MRGTLLLSLLLLTVSVPTMATASHTSQPVYICTHDYVDALNGGSSSDASSDASARASQSAEVDAENAIETAQACTIGQAPTVLQWIAKTLRNLFETRIQNPLA